MVSQIIVFSDPTDFAPGKQRITTRTASTTSLSISPGVGSVLSTRTTKEPSGNFISLLMLPLSSQLLRFLSLAFLKYKHRQ